MRGNPHLMVMVVLLLSTTACVRRDGRNSDCKWPGENTKQRANGRHLSADAEFAEDLAIRYADAHFGLYSPNPSEAYGAERDRCLVELFEQVAKQHGVPIQAVSGSLGRNRALVDLVINLPFLLFYCIAVVATIRILWRRYPPVEHGWVGPSIMAVFVSLIFAIGGTMLGEMWAGIIETYRIGNDHISYRAFRLLWSRHRAELFGGGLILFWLLAAEMYRRSQSSRSLPTD